MTNNQSGAKIIRSLRLPLPSARTTVLTAPILYVIDRPAAFSTPFTVEDAAEGNSYVILRGVREVANCVIDSVRRCTDGCVVADETMRTPVPLLQSHRRQVGVDQLNRYGLRDLLQLLRVMISPQCLSWQS